LAAVLTIPAAGSEMSESSVITNEDGDVKLGYSNNLSRPKFAIMNPCRTFTLPPYQTAAGVTDMMMHTMERYFSKYEDATLTDAIAEALLRTVKDAVFEVLRHPDDYRNRAAIMWASSLSHNDLTECGTEKDFACHKLEHELSGLFGVTHGAGLAAVWGSWARYVMDKHISRFVKFAVNVMGVTNDFADPRQTALRGIEATERFFQAIGMPTNIPALIGRQATEEEIETLVTKCSRGGKISIGAMEVLQAADMVAIYNQANK
jgi:alcohol dehydrogenase YqhD (iron-dependent ADH family)